MKKYLIPASIYIVMLISVLFIGKISSTDMAGPGFDLLVYLIAVIISITLFVRSSRKARSENPESTDIFYINTIGMFLVFMALYYEFTKK